MPTTTRAFLVIGFGLLLGASSIWSALRGPQPLTFSSAGSSLATRLGTGVRLARLVLGLSLVGLALFLLAGRTTWSTTAPGWATPVGAALLALCLVAGASSVWVPLPDACERLCARLVARFVTHCSLCGQPALPT